MIRRRNLDKGANGNRAAREDPESAAHGRVHNPTIATISAAPTHMNKAVSSVLDGIGWSFLEKIRAKLFAGDAGNALDFNNASGRHPSPLADGAVSDAEFASKSALGPAFLSNDGVKISHDGLLAGLSKPVKPFVSCAVCSVGARWRTICKCRR